MYNNNDLYLGACKGYQEAGDGMTARICPWCGGKNMRRINSNTLQDSRPGDHPYYIAVAYWEDRDCGYREVTTEDEEYDYALSKFVEKEREVLRFTKPRPPLPEYQQPEYLRQSKVSEAPKRGQMLLGVA